MSKRWLFAAVLGLTGCGLQEHALDTEQLKVQNTELRQGIEQLVEILAEMRAESLAIQDENELLRRAIAELQRRRREGTLK